MGQQVVKSNNSGTGSEQALLLRTSDKQIAYSIIDKDARYLLAGDLLQVIDKVFTGLPADRTKLHLHREALEEAVQLLANDSHDTLLTRKKAIQGHLSTFTTLMQDIYLYGHKPKRYMEETLISWDLKYLIKGMKRAITRKLGLADSGMLTSLDADFPLYFLIDPTLMSSHLSSPFSYKESGASDSPAKKNEAIEAKKSREKWLASLSPDLFSAYQETENLINEVAPLVSDAEDEYFMEQIEDSYYPHIFDSLKSCASPGADFSYKETVVVESIKQFKIVQLGLQRIIDRTVARKLNSIKSQTEFLQNKVLGENSLSLTPSEAEETIDASLEEAQRVREELYKKHVAPVLEKNRQEYEDKLAEHEKNARQAESDYRKELSRKDDAHRKAVAFLKQKQKTELMTVSAAHVREISDLKKAHGTAIRQLEKEHVTAITELFRKYQSLQRKIDSMEAPDFYVKDDESEKAKQLAIEYREKLSTYQIHISNLNDQIHQLEAFVMEVMDKSGSPETSKQNEKIISTTEAAAVSQPSQWHQSSPSSDNLLHDAKAEADYMDYVSASMWADSEDYDFEPVRKLSSSEDYDYEPVRNLSSAERKPLLLDDLYEDDFAWLEDEEI